MDANDEKNYEGEGLAPLLEEGQVYLWQHFGANLSLLIAWWVAFFYRFLMSY